MADRQRQQHGVKKLRPLPDHHRNGARVRRLLPPAARIGLTPARLDEHHLAVQAVDAFVEALGGQARFTTILSTGADHPDVDKVLSYLLDAQYADYPLTKICALSGLSVADLFRAFKRATELRAKVQAAARIDAKVGAVVDDMLHRAQPHDEVCSACNGTKIIEQLPCSVCHGVGTIHVIPDLDRQKVILELADLLKKGAGTSVNVQQNNITPPPSGLLERLAEMAGAAEPDPTIDADPSPPEPTDG